MADETSSDITTLTVQLLSAFVSKNSVPSDQLAELIKTTRAALTEDVSPSSDIRAEKEYAPAVSVRKSLASPDHILSLIDGKPYKTLKRHLATNGLTPDEYRVRYKLPTSYPMVAPSYSQARRAVAQKLRLGHKASTVSPPSQASEATAHADPAREAIDTSPTPSAVTASPSAQPPQTPASARKPRASKLRLSFKVAEEKARSAGDESGPTPALPSADDKSARPGPTRSPARSASRRPTKRRSPTKTMG